MNLRHKILGCVVQVPDDYANHLDRAYWGMLGPHERRWPDGHVDRVDVRTTMLRKDLWEIEP